MTENQAAQLGMLLRERRRELQLTVRQLSALSGLQLGTISGLESGKILAPQSDTIAALAEPLQMSVTDLFSAIGWLPAGELPSFRPYMRAKYRDLPVEALAELDAYVDDLARRYGLQGPVDGEDEINN